MPHLPKRCLLVVALLTTINSLTQAQDFFKDYKGHVIATAQTKHLNLKRLNKTFQTMREAFNEFDRLTHKSILDADTLYMVNSYNVELAEYTKVVWNHTRSFYYTDRYKQPLVVMPDASDWIKSYKPTFRKWVEAADTLNYGKYGRQASWFDAPFISFTVATKAKGQWHFVSSGSYSNNIDLLK
jgi:hypothetical protein